MKILYKLIFPLFLFSYTSAQHLWVEGMYNSDINFYQTQKAFNEYWENRTIEKGKGWKQFKRWESFMEPRVYPDGKFQNTLMSVYETEKIQHRSSLQDIASWEAVGPTNVPLTNWGNKRGVGRINDIAFHPNNPNTIWVGTPAGGLWKTTDGGQTWNSNTDQLPSIGIGDIEIDPNNTNIMYLASGDRDGGDTYAFGILKSVDGGESWNTTGLSFNYSYGYVGYQVKVNPDNSNIINASVKKAGSGEVYRSIDGGVSWETTLNGVKLISIEQHPTNPDILYGGTSSTGKVYKSTDNGQSWNIILPTQGLPSSGGYRVTLAVTPNNPSVVYALISNTDGGYLGLYKSNDEGENWNLQSDTPNLLTWSTNGSGNDGQGWYDLALAISPYNENEVYVGGINTWRSTDGGLSWNIISHWYGSNGVSYKHADEHVLKFHPNGTLYSGNDGGIYKLINSNWTDISDGLQITQFYSLGVSQNNPELVITGSQDNGTLLMNNDNEWDAILGGDGMECIIDYTDDNIMYAEYYYGEIYKSLDGGNEFYNITPNGQEGAWETPYVIDPNNNNILYIGYQDVWKTIDGGNSWFEISDNLTNGEDLDELAVSASNNNIILTSRNSNLFKTSNGGEDWEMISSGLPNKVISYITIHPSNPDKIWVSFSGFTSNEKVYLTEDGGNSWENISFNLPNLPANCIVRKDNSNEDELFLATDIGVYYKNNQMNEWIQFNQGLPNVIVRELEIQENSNTLYAATYGRGLWKTNLDVLSPSASFNVENTSICKNDCVQFNNTSLNYITDWMWHFPGGNPSFSNELNPTICYNDTGIYNVALTVSNISGSDSIYIDGYLNVSNPTESFTYVTTCDYHIWNGDSLTENGIYSFVYQNEMGCDNTEYLDLTLIPNNIGITQMFVNSLEGQSIQASPFGGIPPYTYLWNTGENSQSITPTENGEYWVIASDYFNCIDTSYYFIDFFHNTNAVEEYQSSTFNIFPNPSRGVLYINSPSLNIHLNNVRIIDIRGKLIQEFHIKKGSDKTSIDLKNLAKGSYFIQLLSNIGVEHEMIIIQ